MTGAAAVRITGLTRRFDTTEALAPLDAMVGQGELFGVVGPDGAGKTTLLRLLAGVLRPTAGDALIGEVSVVREPERVRDQLAYMSQRFGLYTDLTVVENIAFYADLYGVPRGERPARLEQLYGFSGLGPFADRLAGALSGGMKQKLSLCCALIHRPPLLLLDEPTFGVDPISRRDLWLIIHEMVAAGTTVIASTAYLDEAERCDRVLLLHQGRAMAIASPSALQAELAGRVLRVGDADPVLVRQAVGSADFVTAAARYGAGVHLTLRSAADAGRVTSLLPAGAVVEPVPPSLEDVFVERLAGVTG